MDTHAQIDAERLLALSGQVRRLARSLVKDRELAEDLAQDAMLAGLCSGPRDPGKLGAWLGGVVRNLGGRAARSTRRRNQREREAAHTETLASSCELAARAEGYRRVVAAVLDLEEPYRSTMILRALEELPVAEIAARQGLPIATVKTRLARARVRLRESLGVHEKTAPAWLLGLAALHERGGTTFTVGGSTAACAGGAILGTKAKIILGGLVAGALFAGTWWARVGLAPASSPHAPVGVTSSAGAIEDGSTTFSGVEPGTRARLPLASGRMDSSAPQSPPLATCPQIKGIVVNEAGRPLAGARVELRFDPGSTLAMHTSFGLGEAGIHAACESDREGRFAFEFERARPVELHATAYGYAASVAQEILAPAEVRLVLRRAARVHGRVLREDDGSGVMGGILRIEQAQGWSEHPLGGDGSFDVGDLTPGSIGLLVVPEHEAAGRYQEVELAPGEVRELTLTVAVGLAVTGRVTDAASGAPIAGAEVSAWHFLWKCTRTDARGTYRLEGLKTDRASEIVARAPGYGRSEVRVDPREPDGNDLALTPARNARGQVVDGTGAPVVGAVILATASGYENGLALEDKQTAVSDAQGDFELVDLRSELSHYLLVHAPGYASLVRPMGDGPSSPPVFRLGLLPLVAGASLEGVVLDAASNPRAASLELRPFPERDPEQMRLERRRFDTRADGRFAFSDLAPGHYLLRVWREDVPSFEAAELELVEGEVRTDLTVLLPWGFAIEGVVVDPDGAPVQGANVVVRGGRDSGDWWVRGTTDGSGHFRFGDLGVGPYQLSARCSETIEFRGRTVRLAPATQEVVEPGGSIIEVVLRVEDATIRGRVLDAEGSPVPLAYVWLSSRGEAPVDGVLTDEEGQFELHVPADDSVSIAVRRTAHLAEAMGNTYVSEAVAGRHILPPERGEARVRDVQPGTEDLVLRLR